MMRLRFRALFQKEKRDARMDDEMRSHIEMQTQENIEAGMNPEDARYAALRQFGWVEAIQDRCRDQRGVNWMENFWQDVRYGTRTLRKSPGFTAVAVLTLAFAIGANSAIFSLIHAALLRELPFPEPGQLWVVWANNPLKPNLAQVPPANADIAELRQEAKSFARIAAFLPHTADLTDGEAEVVGAAGITAGFFETLGVTPLYGRTLAADEERFGGPAVALISYALWQRRFGGDTSLLGKSISIDGEKRTIIGILPPEFDFPRGAEWPAFLSFVGRTEVWLPLSLRAADDGTGWSHWQSRNERMLVMIGRLNREVSPRQAQAEMDAFAARQAKDYPDTHQGWILKLVSLQQQLTGKFEKALLILFGAAGLLLLIACVNVANLLLARGLARQQEMAVRAALGAKRGRLIRQLLSESLLLSVFSSGLALLIAEGCLKIFLMLNPLPPSRLYEASLNPAVLVFTALIALMTNAVFGLAPALQASRLDLRKSLDESGRGSQDSVRRGMHSWLVGAEVALAFVLLTTAGLTVRSFLRVLAVQPGFRAESVLAFDVGLPGTRYGDDASQIRFFQQLTERLAKLPAVRAAGAISFLPLGGGENMGSFIVEGEPAVSPGNEPGAERRWVTPGYFATMGIPVKRGRVFTAVDSAEQPKVVVINETLARGFFRDRDPVGQRLKAGGAWRTIVGVVSDVKSSSLESEVRPQMYIPNAQWAWGGMTMVMRTEGDPLALAPAARRELKALDSLIPAAKMRTMKQVVSSASSARRFNVALLVFFAVTALCLTLMGIYGLVSFLVGGRRREIGVRLALGAQRGNVLALVLQQGMKPVGFGVIAGFALSVAASRLVSSQLYGVSSVDVLTVASILVLLPATALTACWVPARQASRVDPMVALRYE